MEDSMQSMNLTATIAGTDVFVDPKDSIEMANGSDPKVLRN